MKRQRQIWVDADACPKVIKEILYRIAERLELKVILVANTALQIPRSPHIESVVVEAGFDVADNFIVKRVIADDIVVTADIPLAAEVVDQGAIAINPRGELYSAENIRQRLQMRNMMEELRGSGVQLGGPAAFSQRDRQLFANQLDRLLSAR